MSDEIITTPVVEETQEEMIPVIAPESPVETEEERIAREAAAMAAAEASATPVVETI
jgi:hypothetical protein